MRDQAAVVEDRCSANDGGAASQTRGYGSASSGTVEATPPPISSGLPANVVAACVCAWPTSVATWCGCARSTASSRSGRRSRIGSIRPTPIGTGGWCRQTNVGRSSASSCASSQASVSSVSSPGSIRSPAGAETSESSIRKRAAGRSSAWSSGPSASRPSSPRANASRTSWLPVPTSSAPVQRASDGPRLVVLLGVAVVGDVAGHQQQVRRRVEREHVVEDPVDARARVRRPAEVQCRSGAPRASPRRGLPPGADTDDPDGARLVLDRRRCARSGPRAATRPAPRRCPRPTRPR